jgi:ubiquinone/menaquinone biosynthesis C-methylase UbiE
LTIDRVTSKTQPSARRLSEQLFLHNIRLNGLKALVYCYGLSASRYIEYTAAFAFFSRSVKQNDTIAEVGCGHSILPSFWQRLGIGVLVVDTNQDALKWQREKCGKTSDTSFSAVLADLRYLPFREESLDGASCISAIEHIPGDDDKKAAFEIGRIVKDDGVCVVSFPLSSKSHSHFQSHWAAGIPPLLQSLFGSCLPAILRKLNVDRTHSYCERFYSREDVIKRIVNPSGCVKEDYLELESSRTVKFLHRRIIPTGVFTPLEYFLAKFIAVGEKVKSADAIILKMRKQPYKKPKSR